MFTLNKENNTDWDGCRGHAKQYFTKFQTFKAGLSPKKIKIFSHLCQRRPKSCQKMIYHKTPRISAGVLNFLQFLATQITVSYFASLYIYTGITSLLNYITHYNVLAYFSKYFKQNSLNSFMTEIHII